jgi:hypothetical protein
MFQGKTEGLRQVRYVEKMKTDSGEKRVDRVRFDGPCEMKMPLRTIGRPNRGR